MTFLTGGLCPLRRLCRFLRASSRSDNRAEVFGVGPYSYRTGG